METKNSLAKFTFMLLMCLMVLLLMLVQNDYFNRVIAEKNKRIENLEQTIKDQTYQLENYDEIYGK